MHVAIGRSFGLGLAFASVTVNAAPSTDKALPDIDLSAPFETRSHWRLTGTQGSETQDPGGNMAPGAISLCLTKDDGRTCHPEPRLALRLPGAEDVFSQPHFLRRADVVHPRPDRALLLLQVASLHAGNDDQRVATQIYAYDKARDAFTRIYQRRVGSNNNQEIRFVENGPMKGDVISAEPTDDAPFGYWITIDRLAPSLRYEQILRFRSATAYGDGNPLAVIDSEMPNIHRRLGLWRAGLPLPLPARDCPRPHLVNMALWCR